MKKVLTAALVIAIATSALAQEIKIESLDQNGLLVFWGAKVGTTATVEWASSLTVPGRTNWSSFGMVVVTNNTVLADVPMYFRVRGVPEIRWEEHPDLHTHYYEIIIVDSPLSWEDARAVAEGRTYKGLQGYFASITSDGERDFVLAHLLKPSYTNCAVWIGGYQEPQGSPSASDWHWTSGEAWDYTDWDTAHGEPNDAPQTGGTEYLLEMYWNCEQRPDGKWNDTGSLCMRPGFIVEYSDLPCRWDGHPDGRIHYYELVVAHSDLSWEDAQAVAEARTYKGLQGYFASITSDGERDFVIAHLLKPSYTNCAVWIGGYQEPQGSPPASDWHWASGEAWDYADWDTAHGEPNDAPQTGGTEYLLEMYWNCEQRPDAKWNDQGVLCRRPGLLVEYSDLP